MKFNQLYKLLLEGFSLNYKFEENIKKVKLEDVKKLALSLVKKYSTAAIVPK